MAESVQQMATRVLVVDDYDDSREMYAEMLSVSGYQVTTAKDGAEALERVAKERFDLIVLDIALPKVDGITVIRTLRDGAGTRGIGIITVSATVGQHVHKAVIDAGADVALDKPCLPDALEASIRSLLQRRRPTSA